MSVWAHTHTCIVYIQDGLLLHFPHLGVATGAAAPPRAGASPPKSPRMSSNNASLSTLFVLVDLAGAENARVSVEMRVCVE